MKLISKSIDLRVAGTLSALFFLAGCSAISPPYQASISNQQKLQSLKADARISVGEVAGKGPLANKGGSLTARTTLVSSPYADSWLAFLREAIKIELQTAGKFSEQSKVRVSSELLHNELNAGSIYQGDAKLSARFLVDVDGIRRYDKVHSVEHRWESSFMGPVAIPAAVNNYGTAVQKLLNAVFSDAEFVKLYQ